LYLRRKGGLTKQAFHYLTPKLRLDVDSLTAELLRSKSFHAVCSPTRIIDIATKLTQRRLDDCNGQNLNRPMIIWEPVPDVCVPNELENCFEAVKLVDVISPNHVELAAFFRERVIEDQLDPSSDEADGVSIEIDPPTVEKYAKVFLASGIGLNGSGLIVVRCGKDGAFAATREKTQWFPAYHSESTTKVVDPTGGGNAFLGGLAVGLARDKSMEESCIWGSIAASFAIEQIGMPKLTKPQNEEQWNGAIVWERVDEFLCKIR
jgi:sugar/nucleoside kinase (ribokinase family)